MYKLNEIKKTELGERIEHEIRFALGQKLTTLDDGNRANHLRFEMSGDRDDDTGYYMNLSVFSYFNFPLYLDLVYNKNNIPINKNKNNKFLFSKGVGSLYKDNDEIINFAGYGTIDILICLVYYFGNFDNFVKVK